MATVYTETSVVGYLSARPNGDLIFWARQKMTRRWRSGRRFEFELFVSQPVTDPC